MILVPSSIAHRLTAIRRESGTAAAANPGFLYRIVTRARALSLAEKVERSRAEMAALRKRLGL